MNNENKKILRKASIIFNSSTGNLRILGSDARDVVTIDRIGLNIRATLKNANGTYFKTVSASRLKSITFSGFGMLFKKATASGVIRGSPPCRNT